VPQVTYRRGGEDVTPELPNEVFAALDDKSNRIFGGRSPIVAWNAAELGPYPARLLGITFFFLEGACVYANHVPGFQPLAVNVVDPVTGLTVAAAGGRSYNQASFDAMVAGATVVSYDTVKRIAKIANIPQSSYPAGYVKQNAIGAFEHSLKVHTIRAIAPGDTEERTYYLQENRDAQGNGGAALPTKKYNYARADFIIEGPQIVTVECDDFGMIQTHNLQPRSCVVDISGFQLVLAPFECRTLRRNKSTRALAFSNFRYFCEFEGTDPRSYWFHPSAPSFSLAGPTRVNDMPTKAASMGANNLINPAILFWWILYFTDRRNFAWFDQDIHELCDIYAYTPEWAQFFGDPSVYTTRLGDLIHHKGRIVIIRLHKTLKDPLDPTKPRVTFDEVQFRGYATIVEDFAAKLLTVTRAGDGNLQIVNADPDNEVDLVGLGTNLLKNGAEAPTRCWRLPTGVSLDTTWTNNRSPRKIESAIFEAGNVPGTMSTQSSYRIRRKDVTVTPGGTVQYEDKNKVVHTLNLPARQTNVTDEVSVPAARILTGIDQITVGDIINLNFLGRANLPTQDFGITTYENQRLRFTPFGLVLTFDEYLSVTPELAQSLSLTNFDGRAYEVDDTGRFRMKHAVHFRGHGFGWPESGTEYCAWIPPFNGRFMYPDYLDEISGVDGADFSLPDHAPVESEVKVLTHFEATRLGVSGPGGYFWKMGQAANTFATTVTNLDGLLAFSLLYQQPLWYSNFANRNAVTSGNSDTNAQLGSAGGRRILALPLAIDHLNGFAQEVNKLKEGRPLDYRSLRIPYGVKTLDFNAPAEFDVATNGLAGLRTNFPLVNGPVPIDFMFCVHGAAGSLADYWSHFFQTRGLGVQLDHDLPGWTALRNAPNYTARLKANWSIDVTNFQTVQVAFQGSPPGTMNAWDFLGDLTLNLSRPSFDADVAGGAGLANAFYQQNGGWGVQSGVTINLNSYAGVRWIRTPDFQALAESFGFPFALVERFRPLKLGYLEFGPGFETLEENLSTGMGGVIVRRWGGRGFNSTQSVALQTLIDVYNAAPRAGTIYFASANQLPRKVIRFYLVTTEEEAEWKESMSDPFTAYDFANRAEGAWHVERHRLFNTVGGAVNSVLAHLTLHVAAVTSDFSRRPNFSWDVCRTPFSADGFKPDYSSLPPWEPASDRSLSGLPSTGGSGTGLLDESGLLIPNTQGYVLAVRRSAGPKWAGRLATPEVEAARKSQDAYCAYQNGDRDWFAIQFTASDGYTPASRLILLPQAAAYKTLSGAPAVYSAREPDWWAEYPDGFFTSLRGYIAGVSAAIPASQTAPQAPFRNFVPGPPEVITVERGLTLFRETCARILFDAGDVRVSLFDPVVGEPEPEPPPPSGA
jgi:hypothetical protein